MSSPEKILNRRFYGGISAICETVSRTVSFPENIPHGRSYGEISAFSQSVSQSVSCLHIFFTICEAITSKGFPLQTTGI